MTLEKYTMIERERMGGAKTVQSKTVDTANEVREAYDQLFGKAISEYNAKQKRRDQRVTDYSNIL